MHTAPAPPALEGPHQVVMQPPAQMQASSVQVNLTPAPPMAHQEDLEDIANGFLRDDEAEGDGA